jgi:hypothetical protein
MARVTDPEGTRGDRPRASAAEPAAPRPVKRSSTVVMEHPEIPPSSPLPASGTMRAVDPDEDDELPTLMRVSSPGQSIADAVKAMIESPAEEDEGEEDLTGLSPLSEEDFTFASDDEDDEDDELYRRPTERELPNPELLSPPTDPPPPPGGDIEVLDDGDVEDDDDDEEEDPMGALETDRLTVTLVNGVRPDERLVAEVVRVTERHIFVEAAGETKRISRAAGFEHPPGGAWSAWRIAGEDHRRWRLRKKKDDASE